MAGTSNRKRRCPECNVSKPPADYVIVGSNQVCRECLAGDEPRKRCTKCGKIKELDRFSKDQKMTDQLLSHCRSCRLVLRREQDRRAKLRNPGSKRCAECCRRLSADESAAGHKECGACRVFMPTAADIREACRQIQAGWTEQEERDRRRGNLGPYEIPQRVPAEIEANNNRTTVVFQQFMSKCSDE